MARSCFSRTRRRPRPSEQGYMLVAVMFLMAILVISMSVAAPIIKKQIQHDREIETMHRGKQYIRAIRMYYKTFGAYPPNMDALVNTNKIRFLRKKYADPTTGKADWKIIHVGQNKVPTAWGFFLHAERRTAAAGRLHLGVLELEAGGFQRLHVVHDAAVQIHQRGGIHKDLQVVEA
jgi:type II secretory pathway pseudopilin PulG